MPEPFSLRLVEPSFKDPLTDLILELDQERTSILGGKTPPAMFFQLKQLFHLLRSPIPAPTRACYRGVTIRISRAKSRTTTAVFGKYWLDAIIAVGNFEMERYV